MPYAEFVTSLSHVIPLTSRFSSIALEILYGGNEMIHRREFYVVWLAWGARYLATLTMKIYFY